VTRAFEGVTVEELTRTSIAVTWIGSK